MTTPTDQREAILARIAALISVPGLTAERNPTLETPEATLPRLYLYDGEEDTAPAGNTPMGLMFRRWSMSPVIEFLTATKADVPTKFNAVLAAIKSDATLIGLLAANVGFSGARREDLTTEGRTVPVGFRLTLNLVYDKE